MPNAYDYELKNPDLKYVETYKGFDIYFKFSGRIYVIDGHFGIALSSVEVAKRCIDTYLKHSNL